MSCDFKALTHAGIQGLQPYQAGKPEDELQRELGLDSIVKLASNENPLGLSPMVKTALADCLQDLTRYPDSNGFYLKTRLAELYQVEPGQITLGNGSNDLLELIARCFVQSDHEVIYAEHAFVVYPLVTRAIGAKGVAVPAKDWGHDLDAMAAAITPQTRLIFVANPNNPTGTFLESDALLAFLEKVPENVLVVLDEAYYEYVPEQQRAPSVEWLQRFPNLIISRTFSKAYGLAGLRVGYSISHPDLADLLNRIRQPFNCNALALKAAETVLGDADYLSRSVALNQGEMERLEAYCKARSLEFIPSMGNFICVRVGDAGQVYQQLLQLGVIVRPVAGYGMPEHLRVSIGLTEENDRFMAALDQVLGLQA